MITPTQMYWLTRLDSIRGCGAVFIVLSIILGVGLLFLTVGRIIEGDKEGDSKLASMFARAWRHVCGVFLFTLLLSCSIKCFVPTTKEMAAILIVPKIANSEIVRQTGNQLYTLAVEWMEELRPTKKKGVGNGK